ncbi:ADP-ribosylglycohydrolase family protein [Tsukamurella sp. 8F]|uniref:ADP-ribosylglycohydrolase family protein n=1 Tax=unclassified Tsukamurella TaxID=2633480 RepID=UPI0023B8D12C|nr:MULTISPECIES: ADP-ribosylglycohydrolase family protein [unclassified Tsukamurella]MDF0528763.1 ADP-ribosylglycohydrolase family protein [Tsukamurella sp. 8J]MDF0586598.1 ADP-ribosylglycohydrolase family protein [Tsukamurella sp. 8F]
MTRAHNALIGLAVGDALGMPTQNMSRHAIAVRYGRIDGLRDAAPEQPIAPGMAAGTVTDDTEQALLLAELLIAGNGTIDALDLARSLQEWENDMRRRGSLDLLGPSTKAALDALLVGIPAAQSGRNGTTNGAAMRIAPVGIAIPITDEAALLGAVVDACTPTHNTGLGLSAAAAVAGIVSAGIDGASLREALDAGLGLADAAADLGHWAAGASVPAKTRWALTASARLDDDATTDFVADVIGTSVSSQESVVAAIVLADHFVGRPFDALCTAASIGGDTDTIAAIAGAVLGATSDKPPAPAEVQSRVVEVSHLDLGRIADALVALRSGHPATF